MYERDDGTKMSRFWQIALVQNYPAGDLENGI